LIAKSKKADELFTKLNKNINSHYQHNVSQFDKEIIQPKFLQHG